jgi:type I restriction enzyme, S subunit
VSTYPERSLGEILHLELDEEPIEPERTYLTAGIYSHGRGLFKRPPIEGSETSYSKYTKLHTGQFIYSKLFGWEGATAIVEPEFDGLHVSQEFPTFRINTTLASPAYVSFLTQWNGLHFRLKDKGTGVGSRRQRVGVDRLLATPIPLPSLDEQRRIAARLDSALSTIMNIEDKSAYASTVRKALHESVFANEQEQAPVRIGDVLRLERIPIEPDPSKYYVQIGIRSFGNGIFHRDKLLGSELGKLRYFAVQPDRLIVSNIMAWEGAVAVSTSDDAGFIASNRFLSYMRCGAVDIRYLNYYFQSKQGRAVIRGTSTGTVVRNQTLSIKDFEDLIVPLPSTDRQRQVASWLDTSTRLSTLAEARGEETAQLRLSLLNAAFAGKL